MNKIITAVGFAALSAASLQAQYAPGLTPLETTKAWSLAASLRGFYDDNYLTEPKSFPSSTPGVYAHPLTSWGTEVIPSVAIHHSVEDTLYSATYLYDLQWYENHSVTDQSHQFNGTLQHEFSERYKISVTESFAVAQEPTVIDPQIVTTPIRVPGNNVRNYGLLDFTDSLTKDLDLHLGYANTMYAYQETENSVVGWGGGNSLSGGSYIATPSYSAEADRIEHLATLDLRWKVTPETTGIAGYQFGHTDYTSPEWIIYPSGTLGVPSFNTGTPGSVNTGYRSNIRNSDTHYGFIGADESFTPTLTGSIRAGAEYVDYYNYHSDQLSPYVDASLTYQYIPGCNLQGGVRHIHNSTDVVGVFGTTPVLDEETTVIYINDNHKFTDRLSATVLAQAQISSFVGGGYGYNGEMDDFYVVQLNVNYQFNPWLAGQAGYNYSRLKSDLPDRGYARDVMYLGIRAVY